MKKTGVFYGSTTGTTEAIAGRIAEKLGIASADVHDVSKMSADMVNAYEALILGTSGVMVNCRTTGMMASGC